MGKYANFDIKVVKSFGYKLKKSGMGACSECFAWQGHGKPVILPHNRKVCTLLNCELPMLVIADPKGLGLDYLHDCLQTMKQVRESHE